MKNDRTLPEATKSMPAAPASPEATAQDEYLRLIANKIAAEAAAKAEEPKLEASRAFAQAYHAWLAAKAGIEDPLIEDEEQPERWTAQSEAERRLFTTPATVGDQLWDKLSAFEAILGEEMTIGLRKDSVLLLAVGSLKQDIINLELI
jgi:hypothetical protein